MLYPVITSKTLELRVFKLQSIIMLLSLLVTLTILTNPVYADENKIGDLTTVYKAVSPNGSVSFSDQPNAHTETIMVPPIPTVPAIKPSNTNFSSETTPDEKPTNRYNVLSILAPAHDSAFYSGSGEVDVILDIQPALIGGDQVQLFLDGLLVQSKNGLQSRLQTVSRGTHQLRVKLVSSSGEVYKESTSTFTVHRPSIRN